MHVKCDPERGPSRNGPNARYCGGIVWDVARTVCGVLGGREKCSEAVGISELRSLLPW